MGHRLCGETPFGATMMSEGGVAGEGRIVDVPTFHSLGKCTITLTNNQQIGSPMLPLARAISILCQFFNAHLGILRYTQSMWKWLSA